MPTVTLKAHFDGKRILLDEPFDLHPNASLMVTVLPPDNESDSALWAHFAARGLAKAYSDIEPEYSLSDIKQ